MIKKSIIAVVAIVAAAVLIFAAAGGAGNNNVSDQPKEQTVSVNSGISDNTTSQTRISSQEAKKIAQKYIEEPGAIAGTPTLSKIEGKYIYTVPVMDNGANVGEISIDAQTGENLGGAGGAP